MPSAPDDESKLDPADDIARLVAGAGPRPAPSKAIEASVRTAVEHEWAAAVTHRSRARNRRRALAAAVGAAAIGLSWFAMRHDVGAEPELVGTFVDSRGPVRVLPVHESALIVDGDTLPAGTAVETGASGAALLTVGTIAVRMARDTLVELERPGRIRLVHGHLYVDSGPAGDRRAALTVVTAFGSVEHVGTQYQVQVDPGRSMFVGVREGRVRVAIAKSAHTIGRGQGMRVAVTGTVTQMVVEPYDATWSWVSDFVPDFPIEGRSLSAFLDWFARETGRTVVYMTPATRADTDATTLNGSISGLTPAQALDAVVATTRFSCDVTASGQVRVRFRAASEDTLRTTAIPAAAAGK
jgi:hypothetical protein